MKNTLIIICGPDGSGKSKLAFHLIEKYRFNYIHHGVADDIKEYHSTSLDIVYDHIEKYNSNWILDRLHLSEEVYGNIFRDGPKYDWKLVNKSIEENFSKIGRYFLVVCLPPKEKCLAKHAERLANKDEMFNSVDKVYDSYLDLYNQYGNDFHMYKFNYVEDSDYMNIDKYLEEGAK